jgi:putative membrane protein
VRTLLIRWLINTLALYLAVEVVSGVHYDKGPVGLLVVAAIFGLVNSTLRPLLTVLTCPLILLTLGLFTLVINAVLLLFTSWLSNSFDLGFHVDGFGPAMVAGLLIGIVSLLLSVLVGEQKVVVKRGEE